jgi:Flp pilus assembly protein TadD
MPLAGAGEKALKRAMKLSITDTLKEALASHQQGRFREADRLYGEVLEHQPNNADALHLSGIIAMQTGNPRLAVERIVRAELNGRGAVTVESGA